MKHLLAGSLALLMSATSAYSQDGIARIVGYYYDDAGRETVLELRGKAREAGHSWRRQDNLEMPTDGYVQRRTVVRYFWPKSEDLALKVAADLGFSESVLEESDGSEWGMSSSETDYLEIWIAPSE